MTKEEAFKYWELFYQQKKEAFDYANFLMKKEEYQKENSKYGWTIDNKDIKKIALNQNETFLNTFPCSLSAKKLRQDKQHFHINGREFNFINDKKKKTKMLFEIVKGKPQKCVDPHQRLSERLKDNDNEKEMEISGVKIKARQELNGNLVLVVTNEEQLITGLFSLADYIDKFKSKIKDNKNILVEIDQKIAKEYEIPKKIYISTETNRSEDILLLRELILNKKTTTFDFNEEEQTLYCYDENQTKKDSFIKKKQMLNDEIYYLTIHLEGEKGILSMFFSEEVEDLEEEKAQAIDASFTFNLNKHTFTKEIKKQDNKKTKEVKKEDIIEEKEEPIEEPIRDLEPLEEDTEEDSQEIENEKYNHRFDTLLKINKEEIKRDLERLSLEKQKKEIEELEKKAAQEKEERIREKEEIEDSNKLKNYLEQEKYKTKVFKKEQTEINTERNKEVEEVAKALVEDRERKKKEQEEKQRKEYEEKLRLEEERLASELAKMEEEQAKLSQLEEENIDVQEEIPSIDIDSNPIRITAELEKQALENNQENIESLGDLIEDDSPDNDHANTIELHLNSGSLEENEEKEKKRKEEIVAKQLFRKIYGDNTEKGKDFAGRTICFADYGNETSETGWNYILLKDTFGIELENVILANIQTLKEFKMNQKFESNHHTFFVTKVGEKNILQSDEVLINPFSYYEAKRLATINKKAKKTLCYLYIKCTEFDGLNVQSENFNIFVDFVQRSINKMIISSLIKFEVGKDFIFISFDGDKIDAYEEAYNYAVLLNSYRKELKKDKIINAIIVLSSMEIPFSCMNKSSKDLLLIDPTYKAIVDSLSYKIIDSTIKRAIHIGPEVMNHLSLDRNLLSRSRLIQDLVKEEYYECKFVYMLNREVI